jgi:hypothetical protein
MTEYNLGFSKKLAETARLVVDEGDDSFYAVQTAIYLSLLSCEIALKAMLEKSGLPVDKIRKHSHNLEALLNEVSHCEVEVDIANGCLKWVPAARIRSIPIKSEESVSTVGKLLTGETQGASKYPNKIRYGSRFSSFPPDALVKTAYAVVNFAEAHWNTGIRSVNRYK